MKYRIIRGFIHNGTPLEIGDVVDLDGGFAKTMMQYGKIVPHADEVIENRKVEFESREPLRRGRKAKD